MWPWFRWMSTSHLYSSNQQSLTETHAHTQSHWLPCSLFLSQPSVLITPLRRARESKAEAERDPRHGGDLLPHQAVQCAPTVGVTDPGTICVVPRSTLLLPITAREVCSDSSPPDSRSQHTQHHDSPWPCSANRVRCVAARDFRRVRMEVKGVGCMRRYVDVKDKPKLTSDASSCLRVFSFPDSCCAHRNSNKHVTAVKWYFMRLSQEFRQEDDSSACFIYHAILSLTPLTHARS